MCQLFTTGSGEITVAFVQRGRQNQENMKVPCNSLSSNWQQTTIFSDNLSTWSKCWKHSVMAVEKWHHPCQDWLPISPLLPQCYSVGHRAWFVLGKESQITVQRRRVCHCTTKSGRGIVFPRLLPPDNSGATGITAEILHCKRKRTLLMETVKRVRRERDRSPFYGSACRGVNWWELPKFIIWDVLQ